MHTWGRVGDMGENAFFEGQGERTIVCLRSSSTTPKQGFSYLAIAQMALLSLLSVRLYG